MATLPLVGRPLCNEQQTLDGKVVYLAQSQTCRLDPNGEFGPYVLLVADGKEEMEFRVIGRNDPMVLRSAFRELAGYSSLDDLTDRLETLYMRLSD